MNPADIEGDSARIAFWVNIYNALLLHVGRERPFRLSVLLSLRAFSTNVYEIGGATYSLNQIEHGVLRSNRRPPSSPFRPFRDGDPRLASAPSHFDPRIHFLLNCGARSCPPIRVMETATSRYDPRVARLIEAGPRPKVSYSSFDWRVSKPQRAPAD